MRLIGMTALLAVALWGQEQHERREGGRGGMRPPMSPLLTALDTDRDGLVSAAEMKAASASLKKADRNSDGKLEGEEMRPAFRGRGPGSGREGGPGGGGPNMVDTLMGFDADKDGKLTKSEVPERMQGLYARGDANKDNVLTRDELAKISAPAVEERGGPGGPGGRGPMMMDPIAGALDANQDGVIDAKELQATGAALAKLDRNKDGQLDATEVRPPMRGRGGEGERH